MKPQSKFRLAAAILSLLLIAFARLIATLPGMPERLYHSQLLAVERRLSCEYPVERVCIAYLPGETIRIDIAIPQASPDMAREVASALRSAICQADVVQTLLDIAQARTDAHNWKLGCRPTIYVHITGPNGPFHMSSYSWEAGYYLEHYNSGNSPDSYTLDAFATWTGRDGQVLDF